ncbi:MAG: c-type cytochrome [Anaerolineae bacterium]
MKRLMAMAALAVITAIALLAADSGVSLGAANLRPALQGTATATAGGGTVAATQAGTPVATADRTVMDVSTGAWLAERYTCLSCHSTDGSEKVGPSLLGVYGSTVALQDGSTIVADHTYIIESIVAPQAQIVRGYPPGLMPNFAPYLNSLNLLQMVAYIESLGTPPPAQTGTVTPGATAAATRAAQPTGTRAPAAAATAAPTVVLVLPTPAASVTGIAVPADTAPEIQVDDQTLIAGTMIVNRVVIPENGWIVIQTDDNGAAGAVVGRAFVYRGLNIEVVIGVAANRVTPLLHAVLYADSGAERVFEVPGADTPVSANGSQVEATFQVTVPATTAATTATAAGTQAGTTGTAAVPAGTPAVTGTAASSG